MIKLIGGKKVLPSRPFPTPFGRVVLPEIDTPVMSLPRVDDRQKKAIKHAIATDFTGILALIPYMGSAVGGQLSDLHYSEMRKILTPGEFDRFIEADKKIPSNGLALVYSFVPGSLPGVR